MTTFTARSAEDVLALVPVLIGFQPEESVVMLTFGARTPFHARVDLPPPDDEAECVESLLAPALLHGVERVLFVVFGGHDPLVRKVARLLQRRFERAGMRVMDVIQARDGRWFTPLGGTGVPAHGVPYDVSEHPFRVKAVVEGRVVAASRQALVDGLRAVPDRVAAVEDSLRGAWVHAADLDGPVLRGMLDRHLLSRSLPDDEEAARILLAVRDDAVRGHAWFGMSRAEAVDHVRLWSDLVRRAPERLVAGAASVLAFAAWMDGDGALAWCAVDRCLEDEPEHSLGLIMAEALERAVPPLADWSRGFPRGIAG
jgi:hypothetical protein